ncbi:hypothetical protein [Sporisorium scitamineum]|uniref:Uncharacterized protein n=1 Tax=Sporisorium scitamineum TaxID=49012 RepID=A0A0F7SB57_9BASI|nr:hypothetical protein [Sporisorium scitamineum]
MFLTNALRQNSSSRQTKQRQMESIKPKNMARTASQEQTDAFR